MERLLHPQLHRPLCSILSSLYVIFVTSTEKVVLQHENSKNRVRLHDCIRHSSSVQLNFYKISIMPTGYWQLLLKLSSSSTTIHPFLPTDLLHLTKLGACQVLFSLPLRAVGEAHEAEMTSKYLSSEYEGIVRYNVWSGNAGNSNSCLTSAAQNYID